MHILTVAAKMGGASSYGLSASNTAEQSLAERPCFGQMQSPRLLRHEDIRPRILVFTDWYLPGYKSGGPVRTIANVVEAFGDAVDFRIVTRDRDFGDYSSYKDVQTNGWSQSPVGKAQVCYLSKLSIRIIRRRVYETKPDIIYLNSFFSAFSRAILLLRLVGLIPPTGIILAPRGEFSPGALRLKPLRKRLYLFLTRKLRLLGDILWQASSELERAQIERTADTCPRVQIARNLPERMPRLSSADHHKFPGSCRLAFLSRISPIKNLEHLLRLITGITGEVCLDIYGPIEDRAYWRKCEYAIARMPSSTTVRYCGPVFHDEVMATIAKYDFLVLPTLGENFGHSIFEALAAGRPVLISDQTPWRGLAAKNAGWDLPLADAGGWKAALQAIVEMDQSRFDQLSAGARELATAWLTDAEGLKETRELLDNALSLQRSLELSRIR